MFKHLSLLAIGGAMVSLASFVETATAQPSLVTYVSGKGTDVWSCDNPSSPCRTFQYAADQTRWSGEVKALDAANYGPVTIQGVSITGVDGASIIANPQENAITITGGPVNLTRLSIEGRGDAYNGIMVNGPGDFTITDCTVRNFRRVGIFFNGVSARFLDRTHLP
jgi:hypothetical protein